MVDGPILFVAKHGFVTEAGQYHGKRLRIGHLRLDFVARLIAARQQGSFERQDGAASRQPQAKQVVLTAQLTVRRIEDNIALEDAPGLDYESTLPEEPAGGAGAGEPQLDLRFPG